MCGIATIFAYRPDAPLIDWEELLRIRERMVHWGPDGCAMWFSSDIRVGLAHWSLTINDLSESGRQPMATDDINLVVTYNGEIYNYQVLRADLEKKGYRFRSCSYTVSSSFDLLLRNRTLAGCNGDGYYAVPPGIC